MTLTTTLSIPATVLALLVLGVASTYERRAHGADTVAAREVRHWQRGAATFFFLSMLPGLVSRPQPEVAAAIHEALSAVAPFFLLFGTLCFIACISKVIPAWRRLQARRAEEARRLEIAAQGGPYPALSAPLAESLRQCMPELAVQVDQRDDTGHHASLVIDSPVEAQRYTVYALPREHLHLPQGKGLNTNAIARARAAAEAFEGRPVLWAPLPEHGTPRAYYAEHELDPRPFVVEGKDVHLAEAIHKLELTARSERRRREAREAARQATEGDPRHHIPIRSDVPAEHARRQHDRESWERFNLLAPRHPSIVQEIERRTRQTCDRCLMPIAEGTGTVVVTDHDHICKNDASVRIALGDTHDSVSQSMPDCGQCHYENPELYEACLNRLTLVHTGKCPPSPTDAEEAERDAAYEHRARLAALGRSIGE
ncbi:MAG: hypothetical protein ACOCZF_01095 [Halorhodospira sp.]